ncbi:hypothetical protein H6P81_017488 [Aristolochia fimbriata]|uniref:Polygalacturonase n=1 Tax=Aristolochia fimbriata TaxID=158543 RepID=A0AAV7DYN8_ARIFI|nr:hypothetical protein H6P81_017488 [Aristolochia fimbriata]
MLMASHVKIFGILLVLCIAPSVFGDFNVLDFGAVGDGRTDDTEAFKRAWEATCAAHGDVSTLVVPRRTFLLNSNRFSGKCNATLIFFRLFGNLIAPTRDAFKGWKSWITFYKVDGLTVTGTGTIDGQGSSWWPRNCMDEASTSCFFTSCLMLNVRGVKLKNSARSHMTVNGCGRVSIQNIHISSPANSPNTDGINIGSSWNVQVSDSIIESGDDCISFLAGSYHINVSHITCGPGHGISVGSMDTGIVEDVKVSNCIFKNTLFGARIKTKQGGTGHVKWVKFRDNHMQSVYTPIIIDQYYASRMNQSSAVAIEGVEFTNFWGTASGKLGIKLACSQSVPCTDIRLREINLASATPNKQLSSYCLSARGPHCGDCSPAVRCL